MSEMLNKARSDAVERMVKLKRRYSCGQDDQQLAVTLSQVHDVHV